MLVLVVTGATLDCVNLNDMSPSDQYLSRPFAKIGIVIGRLLSLPDSPFEETRRDNQLPPP